MIIGDGDIASVLPEREDLLFFAAGVSNSLETRESEYEREVRLLHEQSSSDHIVYFSSLAVFSGATRYLQHKREMEERVKEDFDKHTIMRIGNITWGTNPNTLINHFRANPEAEVKDEYRYIVDKDEFLYWVNLIPDWSSEMNVTGRRMKVKEVVDEYVNIGLPGRKVRTEPVFQEPANSHPQLWQKPVS